MGIRERLDWLKPNDAEKVTLSSLPGFVFFLGFWASIGFENGNPLPDSPMPLVWGAAAITCWLIVYLSPRFRHYDKAYSEWEKQYHFESGKEVT